MISIKWRATTLIAPTLAFIVSSDDMLYHNETEYLVGMNP